MAVTGSTKTTLEGILKEFYIPVIRKQFYDDTVLDNVLKKNTRDVEGTEAVISMHLSGNLGVKATAEDGALPTAGYQTVAKSRVPVRYIHGRFQITFAAIRAAKSNGGSFVRGISFEMKELIRNVKVTANVYNFLDGSGALAKVVTTADANTLTVDRWSPLFEVGRVLDSYTAKSGGSQGMNSKTVVTAVEETKTMTFATHGATVGDYLFVEDTRGICPMGLLGLADGGTTPLLTTIQGLSRSSYPALKGIVLDNGGTARKLTESILMDGLAKARSRGGKPGLIVGTPFQLNDVCKAMQSSRRFVNPGDKYKVAVMGLDINGVPFTDDPHALPGYTFMIDDNEIEFYQAGEIDFVDEGAGVLDKVQGYPAVEGIVALYREMACTKFFTQVRIEDIEENDPTE